MIDTPGARQYFEIRGSGPVLIIVGSPMASRDFAPLAEALASDHTVVTLDPRGISRSTLDDPAEASTVDQRADDVIAILDALGVQTADLFGSSGGAVTGLAVVARHPGRIGTLIAHEPPLLELLPDAAEQRASTDEIVAIFHSHGVGAAFARFMGNAGFEPGEDGPPPSENPEQDAADGARFFSVDLQATTRYTIDLAALAASETRVVVGLGAESGGLVTARTSAALAESLQVETTGFPGDHGGFMFAPQRFAEVVRAALKK
jgi:pimeloyl-ACP methyl ester carboxylesterase